MRLIGSLIVVCVIVVLPSGCAKGLDYNEKWSLTVGEIQLITIEPISSEREVKVKVTSKGKFTIYCYLEKNKTDVVKAIMALQKSDKILAYKKDTESADLRFTLPADETAIVRLSTNKKAEATMTMTN